VGVLLFYLAFQKFSGQEEELWEHVSSAQWWGIAGSAFLGYLAIVSRGVRWLLMLEPLGYKPSRWNSVHAVAFAYFANTFVPRSGELARCAALNQTDAIPVDRLFGTVISERVVDFILLFIFMTVAVLGNLQAFRGLTRDMALPSTEGIGAMAAFVLAGVGVLVLTRNRWLGWPFVERIIAFLKGVLDGMKSIRDMEHRGAFIAHSIFIWSMYFAMSFVLYRSIPAVADLSPVAAIFVVVAGGFGMVLPAPGGIGAYHWAVTLGFMALGYAEGVGFAVANVVWATQTGMIIFTGGVGYLALMWGIRKSKPRTVHVHPT
jgi:uncharacterized membrane protein YbhN (UPF0104 family)